MKILAIGAHADDIELSCGGTLAKFIKENHEVFVNIVTTSDYTSYNGLIMRDKLEAKKESIEALKKLGIKESQITCLGYETKKVPFDCTLIENLNKTIDNIKPDLIITHHLSSSHQDHLNTSKSTLAAARYEKNIWMFEPIFPDKMHNIPFHPIVYVNVSETFNLKLQSLKKHVSQYKKYPQWNDLITSLARLRGIENNCLYAESFEPIKMEYKICP